MIVRAASRAAAVLRVPDAEERLTKAIQRFNSAARLELGVEVDEAPWTPRES